ANYTVSSIWADTSTHFSERAPGSLGFCAPCIIQLNECTPHSKGGTASVLCMRRVGQWSIPKCHNPVGHILIDCARVRQDHISHRGQVSVKKCRQTVRVQRF